MNVVHLLLGHPQLYDNVVKHCSRNNTYKFKYNMKTILLRPVQPITHTNSIAKSFDKKFPTHQLQILTYKYFEKESIESRYVFALVATNSFTILFESFATYSLDISHLLNEFKDIIPDKLPYELPLLETFNILLTKFWGLNFLTFPIIG